MCLCCSLVQGPGRCIVRGLNCKVLYDWDTHIGMGLQTERQNRNADEEDGNNANELKPKKRHIKHFILIIKNVHKLFETISLYEKIISDLQ